MDNVRSIISNLYIYKAQNYDNLNMNHFGMLKSDNTRNNIEITEKSFNDNNISKENKIIYENNNKRINKSNGKKNQRLDNYNKDYLSWKNNNFYKNEINYVQKNKELIKDQENQIKELKLKKENDALNLLLNSKSKNNNKVRSKLYDYELKQKKDRKKLIKLSNNHIRNLSSTKKTKKLDIINEIKDKEKNPFIRSIKLPDIANKPSTSPILEELPLLHKDFGKRPEYLEKRKKELEQEKEIEMIKQREKKLPFGYKILTEEERKERLNNLKNEKRDLEEELYKLPIARLSQKQKKQKESIEKTLFDIDDKIFKLIGYKEVIIKE